MPWLTIMGLLPLLGAVIVWALPNGRDQLARAIALITSLAVLGLGLGLAIGFDVSSAGLYQYAENYRWIPQIGASYAVGVDGIALVMVLLSAILVPVCVLAAWNEYRGNAARNFFALILVLETFMIGVFAARDVFLFYVFFEAMLIPVYFLIGQFGGAQRRYAAVKFLLYSLLGGLVMLVAVIALYHQGPGGEQGFLTGSLTGVFAADAAGAVPVMAERLMFLGFFLAFAIKAPMWPVHTWLPDAASEAPPAVSVLLVGVLDKVGTFGMITLCLPLFPNASRWAAPVIMVFAVISVLYGALLAIGQSNLMRLIAYTSISHFGFIVLGVFAMTTTGQSGSALYMVNHGFSTAALFLVAGMLISRRGSSTIGDFGGLQRSTPVLAGAFLLAGLSSLALPGLSSFISEFLVLVGTYQRYPVVAIVSTLGIILAALYILITYQRMFTGPKQEFASAWRDLDSREMWVVAPLVAVIIALGFYPKPVLDVLTPAVDRTMQQVQQVDPDPAVQIAEGATP
ncbi:MAG: NADH-quinone oxidoreductase subunit M [Kineosporiaceae bacterium]|nr:NADH-quinone oxidoreductase subunit M [Kineosporiaceae bacterium]